MAQMRTLRPVTVLVDFRGLGVGAAKKPAANIATGLVERESRVLLTAVKR
jgi:hypothetical protein